MATCDCAVHGDEASQNWSASQNQAVTASNYRELIAARPFVRLCARLRRSTRTIGNTPDT